MSITAIATLLQAALSLLLLVQSNPSLPPSLVNTAEQVAQQAINQATTALAHSVPTPTTPMPTQTSSVQPLVSFSATPLSGSAPLAVEFDASLEQSKSYAIYFGDGTNSGPITQGACNAELCPTPGTPLAVAHHTYTAAGTYTATLSSAACLNSTAPCTAPSYGSVTITVAQTHNNQSVQLTASPTQGTAPLQVSFNVSSPTNQNYIVQFGDGTNSGVVSACTAELCPSIAQHTYTSPGTYTAMLTSTACVNASQPCTAPSYGSVTITVSGYTGAPPTITGLNGPTTLPVGVQATWTVYANAPGNPALTYNVVWGDQIVAEAQSSPTFTHTYQSAGTYTPTFTVSDNWGSAQKSQQVVVTSTSPSPTNLTISTSPSSGSAPLQVAISGTVQSNVTYTINFGDGSAVATYSNSGCSVELCPQPGTPLTIANHTYSSQGVYTVTVTGSNGTSATATATVNGKCGSPYCAS